MSEYWKSTPKYWCKQCGIYVRDTKLERANHESTAKHQSALKRSLRDLHRGHEKEEREKERAKREVDRLNGVVSARSSSNTQAWGAGRASGGAYGSATPSAGAPPAGAERQHQLEQLADLGVNIPTELRGGMAMAGDWTVTSTRVVKDPEKHEESKESLSLLARAAGVRKREREQTEEEKEEEKAIKGLFKKPRNWGRDTRAMPSDGDAELDQLLGTALVKSQKEESPRGAEDTKDGGGPEPAGPGSFARDTAHTIKQESDAGDSSPGRQRLAEESIPAIPDSKRGGLPGAEPAVMFKKRKPKPARQK
jgi:hypothetical protein